MLKNKLDVDGLIGCGGGLAILGFPVVVYGVATGSYKLAIGVMVVGAVSLAVVGLSLYAVVAVPVMLCTWLSHALFGKPKPPKRRTLSPEEQRREDLARFEAWQAHEMRRWKQDRRER